MSDLLDPKRKPLSWKPRRKGDVYCAPACGGGCTYDAYLLAGMKAKQLADELRRATGVDGWRGDVHENLGWHYRAISPCGRLKVCPSSGVHKPTFYTAFLGKPDSPGGRWAESGRTPSASVRNVIALAEVELAGIGAFIKDIPRPLRKKLRY